MTSFNFLKNEVYSSANLFILKYLHCKYSIINDYNLIVTKIPKHTGHCHLKYRLVYLLVQGNC